MLDGLSTLAIVPKAKAIAARRLTKSEYEALARKRSVIEVTAALQAHPSFKKCLAGVSQQTCTGRSWKRRCAKISFLSTNR